MWNESFGNCIGYKRVHLFYKIVENCPFLRASINTLLMITPLILRILAKVQMYGDFMMIEVTESNATRS